MWRRMGIPVASAQGPTTIQPGTTNASIFLSSTSAVLNSEAAQDLDIPQSASSSSTDFSPSSDRRTLHGDDRPPGSGSMDALATLNQDNQDSDDSDAFEEPSMVRDSDDDDASDDDRASGIPATRMGLRDSMMGSTPQGLGIGMGDVQDFSASNEPLAGHLRRCQAMTGSLDVGLQSYSTQDPFVAAIEGTSTRHSHVASVDGLATQQQDSNSTSDLFTASSSTRHRGTYLSVASGPLARYASEGPSRPQSSIRSSPKSFFSSLLSRSPRSISRSQGSVPDSIESASGSASTSRSPQLSTPPRRSRHSVEGFSTSSSPQPNEYSPSASSPDLVDCSHLAESTTPNDARIMLTSSAAKGSNGSDATAPSQSPPRRAPLLAAVASFTRSASMMIRADASPSSPMIPSSSRLATHSNLKPTGVTSISVSGAVSTGHTPEPTARVFSAPPQRSYENSSKLNGSATETEVTPTLESIGLGLASLTQSLSTSRHAQPLCGAILDNKYLLIGTTAGLEFLPLPVPGGAAQNVEGGRLSKKTRKPIQIIKKTRFKELTVLSERSNILLAIAGRNDHVRVYALEGIRAIISREMATLDVQDGYAFSHGMSVESAELLAQDDPKGKGRATSGSPPQPAQAFRFPPRALAPITVPPPPEYSSLHTASNMPAPSPTRPPHRRQASLTTRPGLRHSSSSSVVRAVPMNHRLVSYHGPSTSGSTNANARNAFASSSINAHASARSLRGSRSREFVASRRNSTATIVSKRRSRGDMNRYSVSSLNGERLDSSDAGPWDESVSGLTSPLGNAASADVNHGQGNQDQSGRWESSTSASDSPSSHSTNEISSRSLSTTATEPDALPTNSGRSAQASPEVEVEPGPKPAMPTSDIKSDNAQRDGWIDGTRMTAIQKIVPREPTRPRIAPGQVSPSMMLAEFFRDSEPPIDTQDLEVPHDFDSNRTSADSLAARRNSALPCLPDRDGDDPPQMRDRDRDAESRGGEFLTGCSSSSSGSALPHVLESRVPPRRMIARAPKTTVRPDNGDDGPTEAMRGVTLAEIIRDDPPPPSKSTMLPTSPSVPNGLLTAPSPSTSGSGPRASKRWSMGNVSSRLLSRPSTSNVDGSGSSSQSTRESALAAASSGPLPSTSRPWMASRSASAPVLADNSDGDRPFPLRPSISETATSSSTIDNKRRSRPNTLEPPILKVPQSSRVPSDAHLPNASSPLDYVKLARTKGARLLRAVETKKRTYLAVLGGDEGDRIELFTGSRGISLSLNRTFVLPERPRTIDFQLQGDDLVDIYLIYSDSIFALEPATVRVREVGVGRGERRARRERERRIRDLAASASEPVEGADLGERPLDPSLTPHPAESVSRRTPTSDSGRDEPSTTSPDTTPQAAMSAGNSSSGTPLSIPPPPHLPLGPNGDNTDTPSSLPTPTMVDSPLDPDDPSTIGSRLNAKFINAPYTTFQQLPFIPPVPSSILASAWTIPPLYTDVIGADADADAGAMDDADASVAMPDPPFSIPTAVYSNKSFSTGASRIEPPLLSPISLLGPAAHRSQGPPGLFFVTKGSNLSGIVTAEGKSVIKRPLLWSETAINPDPEQASFVEPNRIEMLICKRSRTVIINLARSGIHAIAVAGQERDENPFGETLSVAPASGSSGNSLKEIAWLGTHASSQLFFAERVGSSFVIKCLYARH